MNTTPEVVRRPPQRRAERLMVLLPGAYMTPAQFIDAGFADVPAIRDGRLDLALPALDLTAITAGTALAMVQAEAVEPARRAGYREVWLGGISLGGFLALAYAADGLGTIDGLCLLAPYPGSRITQAAIAAAGGPATWQPAAAQRADPEFRVWHWLRRCPADLPVFCGYGIDDRFADGMAALAAALPATEAVVVPGGHDWTAWRPLWDHFLATGPMSPMAAA